MAAFDYSYPSQSPVPRGDENDALRQWNVSRGDHIKWEEGSGDYEVGIRNFWGIKTDNTNLSTVYPGREEGRLLPSVNVMTGNKSVGVGTHVAPATQNFNPFQLLTQEREDRKSHFRNFSPPGIDKILGAGVNKIKQLLNVNFLQRRDGVRPQQSGGGETEGAECSPGNSFVNSWVERTRGRDTNMEFSPGNPFRNAWVESSKARAEERTGGTHPNMAALLRRQQPDDSVLRMAVPINYTELLAHRVPVKRHCPGIEATPSRYRPYKSFRSG